MEDDARRPRNLVLSVCDFKLQQQQQQQQQGLTDSGRVGSKLIVGRGTQLLLHGGADEFGCYSDLHAIELGPGRVSGGAGDFRA
ncbi:Ras family domain-containing protein, putative [Eimeria tenella]|uniref:Ras family domain-containing protein, putative n=1 Tax=Eimeria tenella TaxID=5802 RepID=U6KX34_EIMTE|nr:Ras family domain-containing protein, putative [Eimeria tenella]CDJ40060.1 Ras family domain-containing protein, putative [Eimeria tenella]|eukprot:XP_013230813.1 Ras family domain-containing protein, putative [Eimeria tenella]